jgi:TRAP-type C4-dicarboxylate transport system permease small subunit
MQTESVWLGPLRRPMQIAMYGFVGLTLVIFVYILFHNATTSEPIGMYEMLRPAGHGIIWIMLLSLAGAVIFTSIYLSDTTGVIEGHPHGFFDVLSLVFSRMAMIGNVFVVLVMFYEVIARYAFNAPTLWANELSLWIAGFLFLFAGQYAMQQRSHIRIYVVYDIMPRWMQKASDVLSVLLIWLFTISLVWGGFNESWDKILRMETFGTAWDPPIPATIKPAILIIISLVALQALSNLIADWNKAAEHHSPLDEVDETEIEAIRRTLREN